MQDARSSSPASQGKKIGQISLWVSVQRAVTHSLGASLLRAYQIRFAITSEIIMATIDDIVQGFVAEYLQNDKVRIKCTIYLSYYI